MKKYNPNIHHRRSIRLKGYDYSQAGLYFITLCIQNRENLFGEIKNGKMILNIFGKIAKEEWEKTAEIRKNCSLGEFIIMPNHFHAIISIDYQIRNNNKIGEFKSPSQTIGAIIRGFKGASTKRIKEFFINNLEDNKEDNREDNRDNNNSSTGVLQYAPTAPTAPTAPSPTPTPTAPSKKLIRFIKHRIINKKSIWQRDYWEHIIRNKKAYINISKYIKNNPRKWENDKLNGGNGKRAMEPQALYGEELWMI